jgi:hypothetical protein
MTAASSSDLHVLVILVYLVSSVALAIRLNQQFRGSSEIERHLYTKHSDCKYRPLYFFRRKCEELKQFNYK